MKMGKRPDFSGARVTHAKLSVQLEIRPREKQSFSSERSPLGLGDHHSKKYEGPLFALPTFCTVIVRSLRAICAPRERRTRAYFASATGALCSAVAPVDGSSLIRMLRQSTGATAEQSAPVAEAK